MTKYYELGTVWDYIQKELRDKAQAHLEHVENGNVESAESLHQFPEAGISSTLIRFALEIAQGCDFIASKHV